MGATPQVDVPHVDVLHVDVAVVGGGIAGLWLLARLQANGHSAVLVEAVALGAGQKLPSQGIIHSGLKSATDPNLKTARHATHDISERGRDRQEGDSTGSNR